VLQALQEIEALATMVPTQPGPYTQKGNNTARAEVVPRPTTQAAKPWSRRSWLLTTGVGGGLLLGLVVLLYSLGSGQGPPIADKGQVSENFDRDQARQKKDKGKELAKGENPSRAEIRTEEPIPVGWNTSKAGAVSTNSLGMMFAFVPRGRFWMGGGGGKPGDKEVEIPYDFYLGKYELTQEEWKKVTGSNPSYFEAVTGVSKEDQKRFPLETVSWDDVQLFLGLLNAKEKPAGWLYRLPKEVEWEYACRGGPLSNKSESAYDFYLDKPTNQLQTEQANFMEDGNGLKRTCKVGSYKPNRLGLYDMHGNVWEWCDDTEKAPDGASARVFRGGGWGHFRPDCQAANRVRLGSSVRDNRIGFRLARVPVGK
jgi:formylglycine-generating enzyme required for sulfatase activity